MKDLKTNLEWALHYQSLGLSVIPVSRDKKPLIPWKEYQSRRASPSEIVGWFKNSPEKNIGVATGKISGIVVVDIEKGGNSEGYPPTVTAKSGGAGVHLFYKHPGYDVPNGTRVKELTDIRGDGGFIIVAPSKSEKGQYEWITPFESLEKLTEMPEWVGKIKKDATDDKKWLLGKDGVLEGSRNDTAASLAGKILTSTDPELWESLGWDQLKVWNLKNEKPLPERELRGVWESIKHKQSEEKPDDIRPNTASILLDSILKDKSVVLFRDESGEGYIALEIQGRQMIKACRSKSIKKWLSSEIYRTQKKAPGSEIIKSILAVLDGKACFDGPEIKLHNRVAWKAEDLWYDLANETWQAVKISKTGWEIVDKPPILFKRYSHNRSQIIPTKEGDVRKFLDYINIVNPEHRLLLMVFLVSCFVPDFPHVMLVAFGAQGSSKSTLSKLTRLVVDPSLIDVASFPKSIHELVQTLAHHYFIFFDNVSHISEDQSDTLCKAITGGGHSKRELFENDEDVIYNFMRCIGLNGINLVTTRPDLLERSLLLELERIDPAQRKTEKALYESFRKDLPAILGGVFNVLVKTLSILPTIKLDSHHRMADWTITGCAIAEALGHTKEEFLTAYQKNITRQTEMLINENIVATAIVAFMEDKEDWRDTPTNLLKQLSTDAAFADIDTREKYWPKGANVLSKRLNELSTPLKQMGILINISTNGTERYVHIQKIKSEVPSPNLKMGGADLETKETERSHDGKDTENTEIPF
jgi:hypothetical protein